MPITSFTIAGDEVDPILTSLNIRETTGAVSTLICDIESLGSPVLRFNVRDEIIVEEDGTRIFAGYLTQTLERGFAGEPNLYDPDTAVEQIVTTITAEDYSRIAEHVHVTETVAAGTLLKTFLTTLITNYFGTLGVTLHGSQVNGPDLPDMVFDLASGDEVLKSLSEATGYVYRIDYDKKLRMWAPGDLVAPFNINEFDDPASWTDDVEVENIQGDDYANKVIVIGDLISEQYRIESWVGDGITDTFELTYTPTQFYGFVYEDFATDMFETLTTIEFVGTATWTYDPATNTIHRETGPPEVGADIRIRFDGTFRPYAVAGPPSGIDPADVVEIVIGPRSDIKTQEAAQALADSMLEESLNAGEQKATYKTRRTAPTLRAGQLQTIAATPRQLAGDYIITDISVIAETPATSEYVGLGLLRTVTAKKNHALAGKWQHTYRDWLSDKIGAGGATQSSISGVANVGPDPPIQSVQYNDGGRFGGEPEFLYDKTTATVELGTGHTPGGFVNLLIGAGHTVN